MNLTIDSYGKTDIGRQRSRNEDQFLIADLGGSKVVSSVSEDCEGGFSGDATPKIFAVADGIGGARGGALASRMVIENLADTAKHSETEDAEVMDECSKALLQKLHQTLKSSQREIEVDASTHPTHRGMGTTVTLACICWPHVQILHLGDSRCYIRRRDSFELLTKDQTLAQKLRDKGASKSKYDFSRFSNILMSFVGENREAFHPRVYETELELGDAIILSTDGLTKYVSDDAIKSIHDSGRNAKEACEMLVNAANEAGGNDNITVVVSRIVQEQDRPSIPSLRTTDPVLPVNVN